MRRTAAHAALVVLALVGAACAAEGPGAGSSEAASRASQPAASAGESATSIAPPSTTQADVAITAATTRPPPTAPPAPDEPPPPVFEPGDDPVAFAIADLAHRLGIPEEHVALIERQEVVWRDGSLGCPQPGMAYTQVLVDGSKIVLQAEGASYDYHQGGGRAPFLCANPTEG